MPILKTLATAGGELGRALVHATAAPLVHKYKAVKYRRHPAAVPVSFDWEWAGKRNRIALVNLLGHDRIEGDYLEIGCDRDELFDAVAMANRTGVDPNRGGTVRAESDQFFATDQRKFDVIWIDGLHTYDQIRRDVVNSMRALKAGGWVGIHDLLPRNWIEAYSPRLYSEGAWSGDVWKVAFELARTPGIDFRIVNIDRGVGVFHLTQGNAKLFDMRRELEPATFAYLHANIGKLNVIEWAAAFDWIVAEKRRQAQGRA